MRKLILAFGATLMLLNLGTGGLKAQCSGGIVYTNLIPTNNWQTEPFVWAGDLLTFNAVAGTTYEFSLCAVDGGSAGYDSEITLQDGFGTPIAYNDDFCGLQSKLTWTAPSTGPYQVLISEFQCFTNQINTTVAYRSIAPATPNDVALTSALFASEYTRIPLQHVQAQTFDGEVTNVGAQVANGVGLQVDVINASTSAVLQTFISSPLTNNLATGAAQSYLLGPWTPTQQGVYRIKYTAFSSSNSVATNDTVSYLFHVTDSTYARDDNAAAGSLTIGSVGNPMPGELGVVYEMQTAADLSSIDVWVDNSANTATGVTFSLRIRQASPLGLPGNQLGTTVNFTVPAGFNNWVNLPIANGPINLPAGKYAVSMVEGNNPVPVTTTTFIFNTNSFWVNALGLSVGWEPLENFNFNVAYALRMNVQQPCPNLSSNIQSVQPGCNLSNGSATMNVSGDPGPYTYLWSNGAATQTIQNVPAGTYVVTATLPTSGCSITDTVVLSSPSAPSIQGFTSTPVVCFGQNGSASLNVTGGTPSYNYAWSNGGQGSSISAPAGTYTVTVTDQNNCTVSSGPIQIAGPSAPLTTSISQMNPTCGQTNGSATVTATGGYSVYTYSWSNGGSSNALQNVGAGIYVVTVTDSGGCAVIDTVSLVSPGSPTIALGNISAPLCHGGNTGSIQINVTGGQPGYTYLWSNGSTGNSLSGPAGSYTVTVTDALGCFTTSAPIVIPAQPALTSQITSSATGCTGPSGTASVTAMGGAGGFTYTWSNGANGASIQGLTAGQYVVTIVDANNCTLTDTVVVQSPVPPVITSIQPVDADCFGQQGYILVNATSSNGNLNYQWSNGGSGDSLSAGQGTYQVVVTDPLGCSDSAQATINHPTPLANTFAITDANCNANDGEAVASVTGGTGSYTYSWSNGSQGASSGMVGLGNYVLTITDQNGCSLVDTASIANIGAATLAAQVVQPDCHGDSGQVVLTLMGGTPGFSFTWSDGSSNQMLVAPAGNYTVSVVDQAGCVVNGGPYAIQNPPALVLTVNTTSASGVGVADGSATVNATGGTGGYSYMWSNGFNGASNNALLPGVYTVVVTDMNGCQDSIRFTIDAIMGLKGGHWLDAVRLYPNPSQDYLHIDLPKSISLKSLQLMDAGGRTLDLALRLEGQRLNVQGLAKGLYFLQLETQEGQSGTLRFLVD